MKSLIKIKFDYSLYYAFGRGRVEYIGVLPYLEDTNKSRRFIKLRKKMFGIMYPSSNKRYVCS